MPATECPTQEKLSGFVLGTISEDSADSIADHVEACTDCDATVESLELESDTIVEKLRHPAPQCEFSAESGARRAEDLVVAVGRDVSRGVARPTVGDIGQYKLLGKLGEGGMGTVYKALHTKLEKLVALKLLPAERLRAANAVARFEREMKAVGRLEHPNIVRATDAGEIDRRHFLVMELVDGVDLSALMKLRKQLAMPDACEIVRQAALGLQHAHEHGLVHRDIKPSNLMLARGVDAPVVKLLDLGLALLERTPSESRSELTGVGQVMGTLDYLAPEQATNAHGVDIRADIYGLGATLYKLLTGRPPLSDEKLTSPLEKLLALANREVPALAEKRPDLPASLCAVVHRMLAKDPAERFSTPAEVADALAPFCGGHNLAALLNDADDKTVALPEAVDTSPSKSAREETVTMRSNADDSPAPGRVRRSHRVTAIGWAVLAACIMAGIVIIVRDKDGNKVAEVPIPEGGSTEFVDDGDRTDPAAEVRNRSAVRWALSIGGRVEAIDEAGAARDVKSLNDFPQKPYWLRVLLHNNPRVTDDSLANIAGADGIVELSLVRTTVTDRAMPHIATLTNLERLSLDETEISAAGIVALAELRKLTALSAPAGDEVLAAVSKFTQLREFHISGIDGQDILHKRGERLTNAGLAHLAKLKNLERLSVSSGHVTDDGLAAISELKGLTAVTLNVTHLTDDGVAHLEPLSQLYSLLIAASDSMTDAACDHLAELPNLRSLNIHHCRSFTGSGLAKLSHRDKLTSLHLADTSVDDDALEHVVTCKNLLSLVLERTKVTDEGLNQYLPKMGRLAVLNLQNNPQLTDAIVEAITRMPALNVLLLVKTDLTADGVARIRAARNTHITSNYPPGEIERLVEEHRRQEAARDKNE